jgi:hypothetical protein
MPWKIHDGSVDCSSDKHVAWIDSHFMRVMTNRTESICGHENGQGKHKKRQALNLAVERCITQNLVKAPILFQENLDDAMGFVKTKWDQR